MATINKNIIKIIILPMIEIVHIKLINVKKPNTL